MCEAIFPVGHYSRHNASHFPPLAPFIGFVPSDCHLAFIKDLPLCATQAARFSHSKCAVLSLGLGADVHCSTVNVASAHVDIIDFRMSYDLLLCKSIPLLGKGRLGLTLSRRVLTSASVSGFWEGAVSTRNTACSDRALIAWTHAQHLSNFTVKFHSC